MRLSLIFSILFISFCVRAKDVWIDVVGIDELHTAQNLEEFYQSAQSFESQCKSSMRKPECVLFLNDDPKLHDTQPAATLNLPNNQGPPSRKRLTDLLTEKLTSATDKDTIIISLHNHGAPVRGLSPSCIWFNSTDFICENEIREILQKKPPGVKVFIDADACFSGAFVDLSSPEICVATASDRLNYGTIAKRNIWKSIEERHPTTLADLREPIFNESGTQKFLGSQLMINQMCFRTRQKLGTERTTSDLSFALGFYFIASGNECRDPGMTAKKISGLADSVLKILSETTTVNCDLLSLPRPICAARLRLAKGDAEVRSAMLRLTKIAAEESEISTNFFKIAKETEAWSKAAEQKLATLSDLEKKELTDSVTLGITPDWQKFSKSKLPIVQEVWNSYQPIIKQFHEADALRKESDAITLMLKQKGYYDDLLSVQACFFENAPYHPKTLADTDQLHEYQYSESTFPERLFSEKDYEEARKCETSIRF